MALGVDLCTQSCMHPGCSCVFHLKNKICHLNLNVAILNIKVLHTLFSVHKVVWRHQWEHSLRSFSTSFNFVSSQTFTISSSTLSVTSLVRNSWRDDSSWSAIVLKKRKNYTNINSNRKRPEVRILPFPYFY